MNRIEKKFREAKEQGSKIVSVFLTAGYPSMTVTEKLVYSLSDCGVDFFEIGFPFSDPIADGATIQRSSEIALKNGVTWEKTMRLCKNIRKKSNVPLILMSYSNPLFARTWTKSVQEMAVTGFDGAIIPDLIPDESSDVQSLFARHGLSLIHLLSSTSSDKRIRLISDASTGFIYCVSVTGVTGARNILPYNEIKKFLSKVKKVSKLPLILGFGISNPRQFRQFNNLTDGYVIGSAFIKILGGNLSITRLLNKAKTFIKPFLKESIP